MNASTPLLFVLMTSLVTIGACSSESVEQGQYQSNVVELKKRQDDAKPKNGTHNTAGTDGAHDAPQRVVTENDRYWIGEAAKACKNREFTSLFAAFVRSAAVRDLYTADPITLSTKGEVRRLPRARYFDFPIAMQDYTFISKNSEGAGPNVEYVRLTFNQSQSDKYRIDWVRVRYGGIGNDADGEAEIIGTYGLPGYLIFEPTDTCWRLIEDSVYEGPYEGNLNGD